MRELSDFSPAWLFAVAGFFASIIYIVVAFLNACKYKTDKKIGQFIIAWLLLIVFSYSVCLVPAF